MDKNIIKSRLPKKIWLILIVNIFVGIGTMIPILFMQRSIDFLLEERYSDFSKSILLYLLIYILVQMINIFVSQTAQKEEVCFVNSLKEVLAKRILSSSPSRIKREGGEVIYQKLIEDFSTLENRVITLLLHFTFSVSSGIVGLIIFAKYNKLLLFILLPFSLITTLLVKFSFERIDQESRKSQEKQTVLNKSFRYIVAGATDIILFRKESLFLKQLNEGINELLKTEEKNIKLQTISQSIINLSFNILIGLLIFIGGWQIVKGNLTVGALVAIIMYNSMVTDPIYHIVENQKEFLRIKNALSRIERIYNSLPERQEKKIETLESIELEKVSLSYGENLILNDFSYKINRGDIVRIIGKTGSGKSSIAKLITGVEEASVGRILFNGEEEVFSTISTVFQNNILLDDTIKNNITLFYPIEKGKYKEIIRLTHVEEIIEKYGDLPIGERGNKLSGGEKTRILVARALLQEADLYLFDEISTGLDLKLFEEILEKTLKFLYGKTILIIDHNEIDEKYFNKSIVL